MSSLSLPAAARSPTARSFSIAPRVIASAVLALALIAACGGWAARAKLSGAVIAHGRVVAKAQLKKVQHSEGGIVGAILVENGDRVQAGDVLLRLDATQKEAELGVMESQQRQLVGRRARLEALRADADAIAFPPGFATAPETAEIAAGEQRLFDHDRQMQKLQVSQMLSQIDQYGQQIAGLQAQGDANDGQRRIVGAERERMLKLGSKGLVETTRVDAIEREVVRIDGAGAEILSNVARVNGQIGEARLHILEIENKTRTDAQSELRDVEARLAELDQRILAARDRLSRTEIRAPISGIVNDLTVHTVNGVISAGETIMAIVPDGEMTVEARVSPTDIDQVAAGQSVKLRFSSFSQRTTPELHGQVSVIAASATTDPATGTPYYEAVVRLDDLAKLGDKQLVTGMPVEVFFQTEERTVLSYLAKPVIDQIERTFREE